MKRQWIKYINKCPVIDCHEHLLYPQKRLEQQTGFFDLLHYIESDLFSSGMTESVINSKRSSEERTALFLEYYENIKHTGYGRMVKIFASELYHVKEINSSTIKTLDNMIRSKARSIKELEGWYNYVLKEKCNIKVSLCVYDGENSKHNILKPIVYLDFLLQRDQMEFFSKEQKEKGKEYDFDAYLKYIDNFLDKVFDLGVLAGKFGTPYWRSLDFIDFDEVKAQEEYISGGENNPHLESYIFHYILAFFEEKGLPVQFHTGHVEPSAADMKKYINHWSDPSYFGRIATRFPKLKFVLLHTGFPYFNEYFSLVKNHSNIYADLSWIYIISPSIAGAALNLAIEMLPSNKIIGFGGDCEHVEMTFAHLYEARRVIADVVSKKVSEKYLTKEEAMEWIDRLLYKNAQEIYKIKLKD